MSFEFHTFDIWFWGIWRATGLMLIGMALHKSRVLTGERPPAFYTRLASLGLSVGLPMVAFGLLQSHSAGWNVRDAFFLASQWNYWGSILVSLAWIAVILRWWQSGAARPLIILERDMTNRWSTLFVLLIVGSIVVAGQSSSLYDLKTQTLLGQPADLAAYRGKVTLVVNVASECGYTPQYEGLEKLHREWSPKGFTVLGFPSNDFGGQEPGTAQQIAEFCRKNYGVTFPMFAKLSTRPGPNQSPIYKLLGASGNLPAWNFSKYVIGKDGSVVAFFPSAVTPEAPELRNAIEKALGAK